jgi:catechol 2,3-dioxygenase-like lactoylglutathione lyase family enzyme
MPRLDHVAFETVRVTEEERAELKRRVDEDGVYWEERDHEIAKGVFFRDPDGRELEAITYTSGEDPRRP